VHDGRHGGEHQDVRSSALAGRSWVVWRARGGLYRRLCYRSSRGRSALVDIAAMIVTGGGSPQSSRPPDTNICGTSLSLSLFCRRSGAASSTRDWMRYRTAEAAAAQRERLEQCRITARAVGFTSLCRHVSARGYLLHSMSPASRCALRCELASCGSYRRPERVHHVSGPVCAVHNYVPVGALQRLTSWSAPTGTTMAVRHYVCLHDSE